MATSCQMPLASGTLQTPLQAEANLWQITSAEAALACHMRAALSFWCYHRFSEASWAPGIPQQSPTQTGAVLPALGIFTQRLALTFRKVSPA